MKLKLVAAILLFYLLIPFMSVGQSTRTERVVRGTVTSATDGQTLPGTTVIEADDNKRINSDNREKIGHLPDRKGVGSVPEYPENSKQTQRKTNLYLHIIKKVQQHKDGGAGQDERKKVILTLRSWII